MPYTALTFQEAKRLLSVRLSDTDFTFWTEEEMGFYIIDALRHWSLLSQYWKDRTVFQTVPGQAFYDLNTVLPQFRAETATDTDLIKLLCYHLIEPATGTSWTGSEQFDYETVLDSINRIRNRLFLETGSGDRVDTVVATPPPVQRVFLDEQTIDIMRVAWLSAAGSYKNLRQRDTTSLRSFNPLGSFTPSVPLAYQRGNQPHNSIELWPPSNTSGHLEVVSSRALPSPDGQGTSLSVLDDFIPTLKWGVLADLLSQERSSDAARAQYCQQRWEEGLKVAEIAPSVWGFEIQGKAMSTASLQELDSFKPNWENEQGQPKQAAMIGLDLVAFSPVPDAVYSVTVDLTRSAIVPAVNSAYIQLGKEHHDMLFDYCVHLASFKQGGSILAGTMPQMESLYNAAAQYNHRLKAQTFYLEPITDHPYREMRRRPIKMNNVVKGAA